MRKPSNADSWLNLVTMRTLKERIDELMTATNWTVGKVAAVAGVTSSAVSQWITDDGTLTKAVSLRAGVQLQNATGFSALWLFLNKGPKFVGKVASSEPPAPPVLHDLPEIISKHFERLSALQAETAANAIRSLLVDPSDPERQRHQRQVLANLESAPQETDKSITLGGISPDRKNAA